MRFVRFCCFVAMASCVTIAHTSSGQENAHKTASAREFLVWFCEAEYAGDSEIRLKSAVFSEEKLRSERLRDPLFEGKAFGWEADPLVVVTAFRLVTVEVMGLEANGQVEFDVVVSSVGDGEGVRRLLPGNVREVVNFHLVQREGRWMVFDPPTPRVSLNFLTRFYEERVKRFERYVLPSKPSDGQLASYRRSVEALRLLRTLPSDHRVPSADLPKLESHGQGHQSH